MIFEELFFVFAVCSDVFLEVSFKKGQPALLDARVQLRNRNNGRREEERVFISVREGRAVRVASMRIRGRIVCRA